MNKLARMVHQSHCLGLGQAPSVTTGDKSHTETVEAGLYSALAKEIINPSVFLPTELTSMRKPPYVKWDKLWLKNWMYWYCEILPWIVLAALGVAQSHTASGQINVSNRDLALAESASGVQADFKRDPHPFRLVGELFPEQRDLCIRQFRLDLLWCTPYPKPGDRVGLTELAPNPFIQELRQKFDFKESGIVPGPLPVEWRASAPLNIPLPVPITDLTRMNDVVLIQEGPQDLPGDAVAPSGRCATPVRCDVARHPQCERWAVRASNTLLLCRGFIGQSLSGPGAFQSCRTFNPFTGIKITLAQIPIWTSGVSTDACHKREVSTSLTRVKWNCVVSRWLPWLKSVVDAFDKATITPRGIGFPTHNRESLTWVSHERLNNSTLV